MSTSRQYELVYIVTPEASEAQVAELHTQIEQIVTRYQGTFDKTENWGRRKLAYEIGHHREGTECVRPEGASGVRHDRGLDGDRDAEGDRNDDIEPGQPDGLALRFGQVRASPCIAPHGAEGLPQLVEDRAGLGLDGREGGRVGRSPSPLGA